MNFELFVAKRIISGKEGKENKTKPLVATAIIAIALGLAVMILSVAVLTGFKKEITEKLIGFSSHIQVVNLDNNYSLETKPIVIDEELEQRLTSFPEVKHYQRFGIKAGIITKKKDMQGVVLKGIDSAYQFNFLEQFKLEGTLPNYTDSIPDLAVIISESLANLLQLKLGDRMNTHFIQDPPAGRPFRVAAIYKTGLDEFDKKFVFCDLRHVQKVSGWTENQITGYEIVLNSDKYLPQVNEKLVNYSLGSLAKGGPSLDIKTVKDISSGFFDFLKLIDTNVWVILALMVLVSGFNMISGLLILIINRTQMIGVLKALGASTKSLRKIFLIQAAYIIGIGLLLGNIVGVGLALLQDNFALISLDPSAYFVDSVPVNLQLPEVLLLNIGSLAITLLMLIIPSGVISKISPAKTIKFD